ncbi:MAG: hypothetical protein E7211_08745 [Clostridium lundense]|nr:hypothetical protein [Clostridium lundense]
MRKKIFDLLKPLYPTYSIGQHTGQCTSPYVVIKLGGQSASINNSIAGWQVFEVMCYCPKSSIVPLDDMIEKVKNALKHDFEYTGNITPDYLDEDKLAFMRSIKFRIPKEVR